MGDLVRLAREALQRQRSIDLARKDSTIQIGSLISWHRGDGTAQKGIVDLIDVDDTGARWAFVALGESWTAVNMKFLNRSLA